MKPVIRWTGSPDSKPETWLRINELHTEPSPQNCYRVTIEEVANKPRRRFTEVKVTEQGGPIVENAYVVAECESVVALVVDMRTKYCEILAFLGNDGIYLHVKSTSFHYDEEKKDVSTLIQFPEFLGNGWIFHSCEVSGYNVYVCLVKTP